MSVDHWQLNTAGRAERAYEWWRVPLWIAVLHVASAQERYTRRLHDYGRQALAQAVVRSLIRHGPRILVILLAFAHTGRGCGSPG
jgi:hypothetical protein